MDSNKCGGLVYLTSTHSSYPHYTGEGVKPSQLSSTRVRRDVQIKPETNACSFILTTCIMAVSPAATFSSCCKLLPLGGRNDRLPAGRFSWEQMKSGCFHTACSGLSPSATTGMLSPRLGLCNTRFSCRLALKYSLIALIKMNHPTSISAYANQSVIFMPPELAA